MTEGCGKNEIDLKTGIFHKEQQYGENRGLRLFRLSVLSKRTFFEYTSTQPNQMDKQ